MPLAIVLPSERIQAFCRQHGIRRLSLFGSVLRPDLRPDSDVDVLVEFKAGLRLGLLGLARIEAGLSELIGRKVDLRTPQDLSPYFRDEIVRTAVTQYAA